jgi:hypothetical protein
VVAVLAVYCDSPKYELVDDVAGNLELDGPYGSLCCSGFGVRRAAFSEKPDVGAWRGAFEESTGQLTHIA